jgi:uncharacterized protein
MFSLFRKRKMKNYIKILISLITLLFTFNCFAYVAPSVPPNGTYVLDLANKLSTDQVNSLNNKIQGIKSSTDNEFAILILQNMDGNNIEDVAYTVFNTWGVGKKDLDNGVLIVIAVSERKTRIETGKGVGELTDLQSNDILANTLRPFLKKGDFFGGLNATVDAASSAIESRKNVKPLPAISSSSDQNTSGVAFFVFFLIVGLFILFIIINYFIINVRAEKQRQKLEIKEAEEYKKQWERAQRQVEKDRAAAIERMKNMPVTLNSALDVNRKSINVPITKSVVKESFPTKKVVAGAVVLGAAAIAAEEIAKHQREEAERARKRREREEEETAARRRRDEESSSSSSWPSSSDSGSSWGGGGFDGGSSGGGGASGDF